MGLLITFIGMASSGKSALAREYAKRQGYLFIDVDEEMERLQGKDLKQILASMGPDAFSKFESETVLGVLSGIADKNVCLAPGGSVVYDPKVMEVLKTRGKVVWIKVPISIIIERLAHKSKAIVGWPDKTIEEIYSEREPLYKKYADIVMEADASGISKNVGVLSVGLRTL